MLLRTGFGNASIQQKVFGRIDSDREDKELLISVIDDPLLPILCNVNIGHATPRCIIPFDVKASVDANEQVIRFE